MAMTGKDLFSSFLVVALSISLCWAYLPFNPYHDVNYGSTYYDDIANPAMHTVGDEKGWTPGIDYDAWASSHNFTVGDNLVFVSKTIEDCVYEVMSLSDYKECNANNPIETNLLLSASAVHDMFELSKPGVHYYITSNVQNCQVGRRVVINVKDKDDVHGVTSHIQISNVANMQRVMEILLSAELVIFCLALFLLLLLKFTIC